MSIDEIVNSLGTEKIVLLCGAGLSRQAGIPLVNEIVADMFNSIGDSPDHASRYISQQIPFEVTMEAILSSVRATSILSLFETEAPQRNHRMIARLAQKGLVSHILTTNFDTCIERALHDIGILCNRVLDLSDLTKIDDGSNSVSVIKLHGCISQKAALGATIRAVANQRGVSTREAMLAKALFNSGTSTLLVLGYSFSDRFDINPILLRCQFPINVIVVQHDESATPALSSLGTLGKDHPMSGYRGVAITCNTDLFIEKLWNRLFNDSAPPVVNMDPQLSNKMKAWIDEGEKEHGKGFRCLIASLLFKAGNLYSLSNEYAEQALKVLSRRKHPNEIAALLQTIGDNYRDLQDVINARKYLLRAFRISLRKGFLRQKARSINSLGILSEDKAKKIDLLRESPSPNRYRKRAIECYTRGATWSSEAMDEEQQGKCEGNIGIALKNINSRVHRRQALVHLRNALRIAQRLGDKKSEGRYYGSIASTISLLGKKHCAIHFFEHARRIAIAIGDKRHVAIWTANIGEDYVTLSPSSAVSYLNAAIDMFTDLENYGHIEYCKSLIHKARTAIGAAQPDNAPDKRLQVQVPRLR